MTFIPRRLRDGRVCCSNEDVLCDTCKAERASIRSAADAHRDDLPPNPYAGAMEAGYLGDVRDDPNYDPRGVPADPYKIALAVRRAKSDDATPLHPTAPQTFSRDIVPDSYAAGLAKMRSAGR